MSYFPIAVCSHHDAVGSCAKDGTIVILVGVLLNDSIEFGSGNMVEKLLQ